MMLKRILHFSTLGFLMNRLATGACMLGLCITAPAQLVSIPDPTLQAALRKALSKPLSAITVADMEQLISLDASSQGRQTSPIGNLAGLESAKNLESLNLSGKLVFDPIRGTANAIAIQPNTDLARLGSLKKLTKLELQFNSFRHITLPEGMGNLRTLNLGDNFLNEMKVPADMNLLVTLDIHQNNSLRSLNLPTGLGSLTTINCSVNNLTDLTVPTGLTNLVTLDLHNNQLRSLTLPDDLTRLTTLNLSHNPIVSVALPSGLTNLTTVDLSFSQLTSLMLPEDLTSLSTLRLDSPQLTSFALPGGLTNLMVLLLSGPLTNLTLPVDLIRLIDLGISGTELKTLAVPANLTNLIWLALNDNQLTSLTLPVGLTGLTALLLNGTPLKQLTLSKTLAEKNLKTLVTELKTSGVAITLLLQPTKLVAGNLTAEGMYTFVVTGPPGLVQIQVAPDFSNWTDIKLITIPKNGSVQVTDPEAKTRSRGFYRAVGSN